MSNRRPLISATAVNVAGVWLMRLGLLAGAVVLALNDKTELASACSFALIVSFILL